MFQCTPLKERLDLSASYLQSKALKEFLVTQWNNHGTTKIVAQI